ncbi:MAG: DUF99 family protein [Nitrososphaerota archaeon]|nr:DUF99 family protein [Nitrososphaerota archaeon]
MRVHPNKKAIRALGIAESFRRTDRFSRIAGVVMRSDLVVDGFVFGRARVGGNDATSALTRMCRRLHRDDVNVLLLSGAIISYYNVVDVDELSAKTGLPVVCLTYRPSSGIAESLRTRFADWEVKLALYEKLGARTPLDLRTGRRVYARLAGIGRDEARMVVDAFALQGSYAEPVRVARLLARARHADQAAT